LPQTFLPTYKTQGYESRILKKIRTKLNVWGKAQRESARRPKSDWWKTQEGKISLAAKSRGPNSNALAYAQRALLT